MMAASCHLLQNEPLLGGSLTSRSLAAFLEAMRRLNMLDLEATQVTDAGVAKLHQILPKCSINH